ncbi:hypothetical protein [Lapillicoccus jejuensis]|uniref:hypothetical protein n=1 Tax=Lapillicoccus jejuensis TaxID=402171 RepID=UPI00147781C4|nr:hypothetical protein [Lapillicoccus jejuensis]
MLALLTTTTAPSMAWLPARGVGAPGGGYHGPLRAFGVVALIVVVFAVVLRFYRR